MEYDVVVRNRFVVSALLFFALSLGAGVTPAEGSVKPIAGFTFSYVIYPSPFALRAASRE
jgi:hypothetical protein